MKKFKCNQCGNIFDGDITTTECSSCGSGNIKEMKGFPKGILYVIGVVMFVVLLILLWPKNHLELDLSSDLANNVTIKADGYSAKKLSSNYVIEVMDINSMSVVTRIPFNDNKVVRFSANNMLAGTCYNFDLKHKKGEIIDSKDYTWKGGKHSHCMPEESPCIAFGLVTILTSYVADRINSMYKVTIDLQNVDQKIDQSRIEYIIDGQKQSSNIFSGIKPGTYQVDVEYLGCIVSTPLILSDIEPLRVLTMQEAQDIFNKVLKGEMTSGQAHSLLAQGNVNLRQSIDEHQTLYDVLVEMEGYGTRYRIESFDIDSNTGKIKSGSLVIRK